MNFTVKFKSPGGRTCTLNCIAPNFEECLKKISSLYKEKLISISYEVRKNAVSGEN